MGATAIISDDAALDAIYQSSPKGRRGGSRRRPSTTAQSTQKAVLTHVMLPEFITIKEFSEGIQKRSAEVIKKLMKLGMLATINQEIDFETATLIAEEFGITTELQVEVKEEDILFDDTEDTDELLQTRPPVVVVMGHVDHGKTSLLDKIRSASVVKGEAGGITQHIGAYTVKLKGRLITFLDTPGHEAFTTMRARGAQVTDIAILVVAADDGVMPQTIEAINHAKAANTEIVVAINKMDRPGANPDKVKQELSLHGVLPEEWGGTTIVVPVSAHTGEGIDELLEMVLLTADIMDLKADPNKQAKGTVIEAKLDKSRGPVATVLVQRGTLRCGDTLVTGSIVGRVRAMTDDKGASVKKAGPSVPVEVLGLPEVPDAGEIFYAVTDEKVARQLVEKRRVKQREDQLRKSSRMTLETLSESLAAGEVKDLNLIVKADVQGSVEAVIQSLEKLSTDEIHVKVIHGAVGAVTETDLILADVSNAVIIGFNIRPGVTIAEKAKEIGVDIKLYRVIYNAIEDVQAAIKGMLKPIFEEAILGHIEIRQIFKVSNIGTIGGAYVTDGKVPRSSEVRVVRNGIVVHEGKLASLKRFKDDAKEVQAGYECGLSIENFNDIKEGDIIEAFEMREIKRK
jgi:translation initiation factor IF-2